MSEIDEELARKFRYRHEQQVLGLIGRGFDQFEAEADVTACETACAVNDERYSVAWVVAVEICLGGLIPPLHPPSARAT